MSDYFYSAEICEVVELTGVEPALVSPIAFIR